MLCHIPVLNLMPATIVLLQYLVAVPRCSSSLQCLVAVARCSASLQYLVAVPRCRYHTSTCADCIEPLWTLMLTRTITLLLWPDVKTNMFGLHSRAEDLCMRLRSHGICACMCETNREPRMPKVWLSSQMTRLCCDWESWAEHKLYKMDLSVSEYHTVYITYSTQNIS